MPVASQQPFNEYTGNGVTTVFPYQFQVLDAGDLTVTVDGAGKSIGTDYSISGVGNISGGNVTFVAPPAISTDILLLREIELERDTDYQKNGDLREEVVDRDFDRLWLALQEIASRIFNAMTVPRSESIGPIPAVSERANMALGFDSEGEPVAIPSDLPQLEDALARAETAADESEAAAQRAEDAANNRVPTTSPTGAALIPEGADSQRPATGSIPAGAFVVRGSTQDAADYKLEFWDRVAAVWKVIADRTWVGQQITAAVNAVKEWVDQQVGFAIIYPNGGTAAAPANAAVNSRYVSGHPFGSSYVMCVVELFYNGIWAEPGWDGNTGTSGFAAGAKASHIMPLNEIVVQTGAASLVMPSSLTGGGHAAPVGTNVSSAPMRVKVWKLKGAI